MDAIGLKGHLICADDREAGVVQRHLGLTRAEPGCVRFEVETSEDPRVWSVSEEFESEDAYEAHQRRVRESEWGRVTVGIKRNYVIYRP